jgi:hypothetical protein
MQDRDWADFADEFITWALQRLRLEDRDLDSLTAHDVKIAAEKVEYHLDAKIRRLSATGRLQDRNRAEEIRCRKRKVPRARDCVLQWLRQRKPKVSVKLATPAPPAPEIRFAGLSTVEADYARSFYRNGVLRLREGATFHSCFRQGAFCGIDESLVNALQLQDLSEAGVAARLVQIGWPFPESADSEREFLGAKPVIEFTRGLVGEPTSPIAPRRRLLIEASCFYADDSDCQCPSQVDINELERFVEWHADERFQDWDILQIVLCWFLGVARVNCKATVISEHVVLWRIRENSEEIERKLRGLSQDIACDSVAAAEKWDIRVTLSPDDILNHLLARFTIADAVAEGHCTQPPVESVAYIKRQYNVLQDTPCLQHAYIGHVSFISQQAVGNGHQSVLERNLIRHRLASWLRKDCRLLSWSDAFPKEQKHPEGTAQSSILGTTRHGFLPLGDYISLALGLPTTGCFVVEERPDQPQRIQLANRYSAASHVDDLISGLLGGATEPILCRAAVARCPDCKEPLLNLRCTGQPPADPTAGRTCKKSGLPTTEFSTVDRLIMRDASLFLDLSCVADPDDGLFSLADFSSNRRKLATVWFAVNLHERERLADLNRVDLVEQRCQQELLFLFPELLTRLDSATWRQPADKEPCNGVMPGAHLRCESQPGASARPLNTVGLAFRHLFGLRMPGCPESPGRSVGWIRAETGDFSVWPPRVLAPGEFREQLRAEFWDALRSVLPDQPLAAALTALIPSVRDRMIALRFLGQQPKSPQWTDRYARVPKSSRLLQDIGILQQGEPAALDEVVLITSCSLLEYVIPALQHPWHAFRLNAAKLTGQPPWKDLDEIGTWWRSLTQKQRLERLNAVTLVTLPDPFAAALHNWIPPDPDESLSMEQADHWDQIARGLWYLTYYELRSQLWQQLREFSAPVNNSTTRYTVTKEVQS